MILRGKARIIIYSRKDKKYKMMKKPERMLRVSSRISSTKERKFRKKRENSTRSSYSQSKSHSRKGKSKERRKF